MRVREPNLILNDLSSSLIWTKLLRVPAMAMAPSRWVLGTMCALVLVVELAIHRKLIPMEASSSLSDADRYYGFEYVFSSMVSLNPVRMIGSIATAGEYHFSMIASNPWSGIAIVLPIVVTLGVFGYAISSSTATEFGTGKRVDPTTALSRALRNVRQVGLTTVGPLVVVGGLCVVVMLFGLTLGIPVVNVLGGVLYLISLVISVGVVAMLSLYVLSFPMCVAALSIEQTDGFDAIQRGWAYVIARPIRLGMYALIMIVVCTTMTLVLSTVGAWAISVADVLSTSLTNDAGSRVLGGDESMGATAPVAHSIISFGRGVVELIVAGYVLSALFTASSLGYLAMRRVVDGQDMTDVSLSLSTLPED